MSLLLLAWRNLRTATAQTLVTTLIIALGVGLAITMVLLAGGVRRSLLSAGGPFEIVVGPKGSATQLVASTVLLQDAPLENIAWSEYEALAADPRVRDAVPLALGDSVDGLRIVGTTTALFSVNVTADQPPFYRPASGRVFAADFEAVLGASAARQLGLQLGDTFVAAHGVFNQGGAATHDATPYTVVGMLTTTGTPADRAILVPISSYWQVHGATRGTISTPDGIVQDTLQRNAPPADAGVTAVLLRGTTLSNSYQLYQQLNASPALQAALPGQVLTQWLALLGQGEQALQLLSAVVMTMAGLSVGLALTNAVLLRRREIAVLRALGAPRTLVLRLTMYEALIQALLGVALGLVVGHLTAQLVAEIISARSALAVQPGVETAEIGVVLGLMAIALLAALVPAWQSYRVDAARVLTE